MNALQIIEPAADECEAKALEQGFLMQQGCLGVRLIRPIIWEPSANNPQSAIRNPQSGKWRVQAFMQDDPDLTPGELEAFGWRRVILPLAFALDVRLSTLD